MEARLYKAHVNLLNDYHLLAFDSLDSTNEEAKRLAKAGGSHGAVIWAKQQTAGRGRMGREWISEGGNLFLTVLLSPDKPLAELPQLSFVASVALIDSLIPLFEKGHKLACKWPNDVLLDNKKLAGILLESFKTEGDKQWIAVGVGVNVDNHPEDVQYPATCLTEAGVELISAKIVLSRFIHHFIEDYNCWHNKGFATIRKRWLAQASGIGGKIEARMPDNTIKGTFEGIDTSGSLILKDAKGKKQTIHAADIFPADTK